MTGKTPWSTRKVTTVAFLTSFVIVGIPFWRMPYADVTLPNAFYGLGVITVLVTSIVLCAVFQTSFLRGLLVPALIFPAVLMARVIVEGALEPGTHNLWPLALIIAVVMGALVAGAGALLGRVIAPLFS